MSRPITFPLWCVLIVAAAAPRPIAAVPEVTADQAVSKVRLVARSCGVATEGDPLSVRQFEWIGRRMVWEVSFRTLVAKVHIRSGELVAFDVVVPPGPFTSGVDIKPRLSASDIRRAATRIAPSLGMPSGAFLESVKFDIAGQFDIPKREWPVYQCIFARKQDGWPFVAGGKPFCAMSFDGDTGQVVSIQQSWQISAGSSVAKLSKAEAGARAKHVRGYVWPGSEPNILRVGYIIPNGEFGATTGSEFDPLPAILGYVMDDGRREVWISAIDGAILGGAGPLRQAQGPKGN